MFAKSLVLSKGFILGWRGSGVSRASLWRLSSSAISVSTALPVPSLSSGLQPSLLPNVPFPRYTRVSSVVAGAGSGSGSG